MPEFEISDKNRVRRMPERGRYVAATIHAILDEAIICHVGFVVDGQPFVIPTLYARRDDHLLIHGASSSRMMRHIQAGNEICVTVTLVDGLVLAKSVFEHSVNYRSAVIFGRGRLIEEEQEKLQVLQAFTENLLPGRWDDVRPPSAREMKATAIAQVWIESASAKLRSGPPVEDAADLERPGWAGVIPLRQVAGAPEQAGYSQAEVPEYLKVYLEKWREAE